MTTTTIKKKQKVYKIAAELNLSSQVILDFLEKRGNPVKSHMSTVEPKLVEEIMVHYKKDKDTAERHQKKVAEMRKTQQRRKEQEKEAKPIDGAEEKSDIKKTEPEISAAEDAADDREPAAADAAEVAEPGIRETRENAADEIDDDTDTLEADIAEEETDLDEDEEDAVDAETKEDGVTEQAAPVRKGRKPLPGLTIKGRVDLKGLERQRPPEQEEIGEDGKPKKKRKKRKKKVREESRTVDTKKRETPETEETAAKKKKKKKKLRARNVDEVEVQEAIRKTLASMDESALSSRAVARKKRKRERLEEEQRKLVEREKEQSILQVIEYISVGELADLMNVPSNELIQKCIELGMMVSINQRLESDVILLLADEYGYQVEFQNEFAEDELDEITQDDPEKVQPRAPIVTIMGHVDHGKTTLLDFIRKTNVVGGESGGITQHIGAYEVMLDSGKTITFLDTPGHEAFTAMRARGAQLTDIVVLVVAADDNVMPQTIEAINHAQAAGVPIIVAINKIDKPNANPEKVRQQLSERNVLVEEWGGKYQSVEIAAKQGTNIDQLLEKILLEAELLDLKADPDKPAHGVTIEAELDRGKGIVSTVLVQTGTLRIGDPFIAGLYSGRVRAMYDERDNRLDAAPPSKPVQVTGFDGMPKVGDRFVVLKSEAHARDIALKRQQLKREQELRQIRHVSLDDISRSIQTGEVKELSIIVKGDVDGSVEALSESLAKLSNEEVKVNVIHKGVGAINDADVLLAAASQAIIVGFHVRPLLSTRKLAENEKVEIRLYSVIYDAINEVKSALEGLLSPEIREEIAGVAEVRETFKVPKIGTVAGCYVLEGKLTRNLKVRLIRDGIVIYEGGLSSLKRFKDDVREVDSGYECGLGIEGYNDIKIGDTIEAFRLVEEKRTLQ